MRVSDLYDKLYETVCDEFVMRIRRGQRPSTEEYASRYPKFADLIRGEFHVMAFIERVKQGVDSQRQ